MIVRNIPRSGPEWFLSAGAILAGIALWVSADQRLGIYLLWVPGITLHGMRTIWGVAFIFAGLLRVMTLLRCWRMGGSPEADCGACPFYADCPIKRQRQVIALLGAALWTSLCVSLAQGDPFVLPACLTGLIAGAEFCLFSLLSSHEPWIKSFR